MKYPNLVMDNQQIFLNLQCNLKWFKDSDIKKMLVNRYLTEECAYPDDRLMAVKLQNKADQLSEYYNKLYDLIGLSEEVNNPLYNYDRYEEWKENSNGNSDNMYSEFPMDTNKEKNVNHNKGNTQGDLDHKGHIYGNIGVQTLGDIEKSTQEMYERLYQLKSQYIEEYTDFFMLNI